MDFTSPISLKEAGRIITILRGRGIVLKYREIMGFSPKEACDLEAVKKHNLKPTDLARAAGRKEGATA
jgi:hypothetical protein